MRRFVGLARFVALASMCAMSPRVASAQPVERSFVEFLAAQGTSCLPDGLGGCLSLNPPLPNMLVWTDTDDGYCALVDYAGLAARYVAQASGGTIEIGTRIQGRVTESPNDDGTTDLTVTLSADDVLVWVVQGCNVTSGPVVFGRGLNDVLEGATPALGSAMLRVKFQDQWPWRPLPDLFQILAAPLHMQTFIDITFTAHAVDELGRRLTVLHKSVWRMGASYMGPVVAEMIILP